MAIDFADEEQEVMPFAPTFPDAEPIDFSEEEQKALVTEIKRIYDQGIYARDERISDHLEYDQMFMGQVDEFNPRIGPWEDAANLHVQMPYWLVDALQARVTYTVWSQSPQVAANPTEDDDAEVGLNAARTVEWNLQQKRMNGEEIWAMLSKIRLIHGNAVGVVSYVHTKRNIRTIEVDEETDPIWAQNPDGSYQFDENEEPIDISEGEVVVKEVTDYRGPVLTPCQWDDVVMLPIDAMNLQPRSLKNTLGSSEVVIRNWERLREMAKKEDSQYSHVFEGRDRDWWRESAGDQTRSGGKGNANANARQQDETLGVDRSLNNATASAQNNPEFEILHAYMPWIHPETDEEEEMVVFVCKQPEVYLGAFLLTDLVWTGKRPLVELSFQKVATQWYAMGVCELVRKLSEELDGIHNMRMDVGLATNLPFYFAKASSAIKPSEIKLAPLKIIPVDDPRNIVPGSQQNVTTFYNNEEQLLLQIIERVMGIADLFLGLNPTTGASSRHATGWMGQKQEAEARLSSVLSQDARAFSFMCGLVHDLEVQYGPVYRSFRLFGEEAVTGRLSRNDLWFKGTYDFQLGANVGMFAQQNRHERAQSAFQMAANSPLTGQDMGRRWEIEHEVYQSMGFREAQIRKFIGPKEAASAGAPIPQDEESAQIVQGKKVRLNPSDNDQEHIEKIEELLDSDIYDQLGRPFEIELREHRAEHENAITQKMRQQEEAQAQAMQPQAETPGGTQGGADTQARAQAQIQPSAVNQSMGNMMMGQQNGQPQNGPPNLGNGAPA